MTPCDTISFTSNSVLHCLILFLIFETELIRDSINQYKTELDVNEMCVCMYIYSPLTV